MGKGPAVRIKCNRCEQLRECGELVYVSTEDGDETICYTCAYGSEETETLMIERKNVRRPPVTIKYRTA